MSAATKLKEAMREFHKTQEKYRNTGALDTEPDGVFQRCLAKTFEGDSFSLPTTSEDWDLYSTAKGAGQAARALTSKLKKCIAVIERTTFKEQKELKQLLESELWRVY